MTIAITIRKAFMTSDSLIAYSLLKHLRGHLAFSEFLEIYQEAQKRDDYEIYLLELNGLPVGLIGLRTLFDFVRGKHLYIDDLVVHPDYRGRGLGRTLLDFSQKKAQQLKIQKLRLCTGIKNQEAQKFYEAQKWQNHATAYSKSLG